MFNVQPYEPKVNLVNSQGITTTYASKAEVVAILGPRKVRSLIGHGVRKPIPTYWSEFNLKLLAFSDQTYWTQALVGEELEILTELDFKGILPERPARRGLILGSYKMRHPGSKRKNTNHYRHPKTQRDRRQNILCLKEDGEPPVRGARKPHLLPSVWDDRRRHISRNWKKYRKTQYKPKN